MVLKWKVTIPELTGQEERLAYLYLPDSYHISNRRYPVLYMFDGHNVFFDEDATYGKSWGMKDYMDHSHTEMIIAAVECNHSPDHGRLKEYSPFDFVGPGIGKIEGIGQKTMDWLVHTFKPEIDRMYRTLPDRNDTYIAGSSMGGLMSLYALLEYNTVFSKAAALSPSIWVSPAKIEKLIQDSQLHTNTLIYMDYGELELNNHVGMRHIFSRTTSQLMEKGVLVNSRIIPGGTHSEASWERQIPIFMKTLEYAHEY